MKISAVYKITNIVTGDFYIGSSKNVKDRWACHKCKSTWNKCPNNPMYQDMQKYGLDKFEFEILAEVESEKLKDWSQLIIVIERMVGILKGERNIRVNIINPISSKYIRKNIIINYVFTMVKQ